MPSISILLFVLSAAVLAPAGAQTSTDCNPMNCKDCPDDLALGTTYDFDFGQTLIPSIWNTTSGRIKAGSNGGEFTISKRFDSPTVKSTYFIFFGRVEVHMQAAQGQGIISSIVLESDDLDEVDWEFMGGNTTHVETNYFGKGNTTTYDRAIYYPVDKPLETFHNYTIHWTSEAIEWWIDNFLVRTLPYAAANGGYNFPQTPMNIRLGIWAGGDPDNPKGTIDWAGGVSDFSKAPFTMYVKSVSITDFSSGKAYHYSDTSGSWQSIKSISGNSSVASTLSNPAAVSSAIASASAAQATKTASFTVLPLASTSTVAAPSGFSQLPSGAKIGIYSAAGACSSALLGFLIFYCIKNRRSGRLEQSEYLARLEKDHLDEYSDTIKLKNQDSFSAMGPTPDEYEHGDLVTTYAHPGAAGFDSGGTSSFFDAPVPPTPSVPPPENDRFNNFSRSTSSLDSELRGPVRAGPFSGNNNYPFPRAQYGNGYPMYGNAF